MDGWMEGGRDGCMDGWMDGWMDGCMDDISLGTLHLHKREALVLWSNADQVGCSGLQGVRYLRGV